MSVGRVKWYDKSKGYGFIESPEGDVFFHFSDILMEGFKALAEDQRVSYKLLRSEQGLKAKQIRPLDNRASVRHAARYRTLIHMRIIEGKEADFEKFFLDIPAWFDAMEQDLGLRRIGTWRTGQNAVHLVESDRPYEPSMESAKAQACWDDYCKWQEKLREFLESDPAVMGPLQAEAPVVEEEATESAGEYLS
ncbi:MAG: cold shock domain-containing protein [Phycisphaerae bacterium]|nr:cold shock domain-containing protein [Phycisphaerae bacterium]